jgi:phage terminase small subunit
VALTDKQQVFVEEYLRTWNATEAARIAGYAHPHVQGTQTLANLSVQEVIKARLAEKTMSADEVLVRLAEQARGDIREFFTIEEQSTQGRAEESTVERYARLDLVKLLESGKSHLVKSVTYTKFGPKVEMYDAQAALVHIGKHHGLFRDVLDVQINPQDLTEEQLQRIADGEDPKKVLSGR